MKKTKDSWGQPILFILAILPFVINSLIIAHDDTFVGVQKVGWLVALAASVSVLAIMGQIWGRDFDDGVGTFLFTCLFCCTIFLWLLSTICDTPLTCPICYTITIIFAYFLLLRQRENDSTSQTD